MKTTNNAMSIAEAVLEFVVCDLCGSSENNFIYEMPDKYYAPEGIRFKVVQCQECGLAFVNPRPNKKNIFSYYPQQFYDHFLTEEVKIRYERQADFIERYLKSGFMLDIGCANGDFPRYMKGRGWKVAGVEPSPHSNRIEDFEVYKSDLPNIPIDTATYDLLTAWAVLEHSHNPMSYFEKAQKILKPGGIFIFLVTNFDSLSSKALFQEDPPRHLYFFSDAPILRYAQKNNFELLSIYNGSDFFCIRPTNWLRYLVLKAFGKKLTWDNKSIPRGEFLEKNSRRPAIINNLIYLFTKPLHALEGFLLPLYERLQILNGTYGITTYVLRRKES